jgi:hypothetical protein
MSTKDTYTRVFLQAAGLASDPETIKKYSALFWYSFRHKDQGGLRLTEEGLQFIDEYAKIKTYKVEFPKEFSFTPQVLVWLDNFIDSPYYITKKNITVMKERAAFELYLFSGDVRKFGHNKALARRLSQESQSE